jgi:hypothetical protein
MSKPVILSQDQWQVIRNIIADSYPLSVSLTRSRMKEVLGFTVRSHREWVPKMDGGYYDDTIRLDFYNEPKRTMFLLKYSEHLAK